MGIFESENIFRVQFRIRVNRVLEYSAQPYTRRVLASNIIARALALLNGCCRSFVGSVDGLMHWNHLLDRQGAPGTALFAF